MTRKLNLIASNGKYVAAEGGGGYTGNGSLVANRTVPLQWEEFIEETFDDGVSLKTYNGNYVTAELDGRVSTDRTVRNIWEKWFPLDNGYKSYHGKYLGIRPNEDYLEAFNPNQGPAETFTFVVLTAPISDLSELHVSGRYFYNELNQKVFIKGTTDFMLYKWFLEGIDIKPLLKQRKDNGVNCVRVIGMVSWFDYTPQKYGQVYYDRIPEFLDLCASFGLYVYWTVFADTQVVMPQLNQQLDHFNKVVDRLKQRKNRIGELVNEPYTGTNATANPLAFTRPTGIPFSSGSYNDKYGGNVTPPPYWDFHDFHTPRSDGKRVADNCMVTNPNYTKKGMAILSGEPDKFGGPNQYNGQIYLTNPDESRQMYYTAFATACGYFYHTSAGNFSVLWNDTVVRCCPFLME